MSERHLIEPMPRFVHDDRVRIWKPGHAEHGASGAVERVERYDGPKDRGPWAYRVRWAWANGTGSGFTASLPDCMVVSESNFGLYEAERKIR